MDHTYDKYQKAATEAAGSKHEPWTTNIRKQRLAVEQLGAVDAGQQWLMIGCSIYQKHLLFLGGLTANTLSWLHIQPVSVPI